MGKQPRRAAWIVWLVASMALLQATCWASPMPADGQTEEKRAAETSEKDKPKLLYILLDGFRWDYVSKQSSKNLPGFTRFIEGGVKAQWVKPSFPTVSYPSWTTLSTGLYAEEHGIVGNYFYDPLDKDVFSLDDENTTGKQKWWSAEPIWTTAEKAGMKTAQYLWSRCDILYDNQKTHHCEPYTDDLKKDNFLKYIMKALQRFDDGYDFVQVYTVHVDETGHKHGPESQEVIDEVRRVDTVIEVLLDELQERGLADKVNVVIVSDHGMADTSQAAIKIEDIDNYLNDLPVESIADRGTFMNIKVKKEHLNQAYERLKKIPGAKVYKKEEIPENYHFKRGKYVHDIVLIAEPGNVVKGSSSKNQLPKETGHIGQGSHGYATDVPTMRSIFYANGPAFQQKETIGPIQMVDIYQVLTNVLELTPQPHNGTWSAVEQAFIPSHRNPKQPNAASTSIGSIVLSLLTVALVRYI